GTPMVPRYEFSSVWEMLSTDPQKTGTFISVDPSDPTQLRFDSPAGVIGELRGFSSDGKSAIGIGTENSWNTDLFATDLQTGQSTRLTRDPAYTDPMQTSPDDNWTAVMDGRVDNHMYFAGPMLGWPPLIGLATASEIATLYNNGNRRFFEPYLIDRYGDRGDYHGQQVNACTTGPCSTLETGPGNSASDTLWN